MGIDDIETSSGPVMRAFHSGLTAIAHEREEANAHRLQEYTQRLQIEPGDQRARLKLAKCYEVRGDHSTALKLLEEGTLLIPSQRAVWWELIYKLNEAGRTDEARGLAMKATSVFPGDLEFRLASRLLLPVVYESESEVESYRRRFTSGLEECYSEPGLVDPDAAVAAVSGLGRWTNFYLAYQGKNDLELQKKYGSFVHRIMSTARLQPVVSDGPRNTLRTRVGFASPHLSAHSVGRMYLGWVQNIDRLQFEVFAYHMGEDDDSMTERYRNDSDSFFHSTDLSELIERITADRLDVLVHLDIGMTPLMTQLAALRLAPNQCATWGHPVTSGFPTVDYFLSSDLMEPQGGTEHYSESLIRLPGIGVDYEEPVIPRLLMTGRRSHFGIDEHATVYACCQSTYKYLPRYDRALSEIARRVPDSQFVFLVANEPLAQKFSVRLRRSFGENGLDFSRHCVVLPSLSYLDYLQLYCLSDIFLDSFGFSAFSTALEAIACGLPVVTWPGEFHRGRTAYGILKAMGIDETIGRSEAEYIDVAVRLAVDADFRQDVKSRTSEASRRAAIFGNMASVVALQEFFSRITPKDR